MHDSCLSHCRSRDPRSDRRFNSRIRLSSLRLRLFCNKSRQVSTRFADLGKALKSRLAGPKVTAFAVLVSLSSCSACLIVSTLSYCLIVSLSHSQHKCLSLSPQTFSKCASDLFQMFSTCLAQSLPHFTIFSSRE